VKEPLALEQLVARLDAWVGDELAIRIVSDSDDLIAVFHCSLEARSAGKEPALFWPLLQAGARERYEQPGIYLHPDRLRDASMHRGGFVLELRQGEVTLNIRRL
jgi:hypothetical protein